MTLLANNCCIHLSDISYIMRDREELEAYQVWFYWGVFRPHRLKKEEVLLR